MGLIVAHAALRVDDMDLKERPVTKIVKILQQMHADLEKEKAEDEELYDKLFCWCETVGKEKTAAIEIANKRIEGLSADVQQMFAKSQELEAAIAQLEKEIADNDAALRKADEMRQKELAEFNKNEKELLQSIQALGNAIVVLSKHHETFLQTSGSSVSEWR